MKHTAIFWDEDRGSFLGRNGLMKCRGVSVTTNHKDLFIAAVTSKGKIGRCAIVVPLGKMGDLIRALEAVRQ